MVGINNVLSKADNVLLKIEKAICGILIVVMSCVIFLQIVFRVLKYPLVWSEELSRFMFIWLIYVSVCISTQKESHLCCDILPIVIHGEVGRNVIKIISNVLCMCFFVFVAYFGVGVLEKMMERPQYSAAMHMNMIVAYIGPYLGAALATVHYIILIFREIGEILAAKGKKEG